MDGFQSNGAIPSGVRVDFDFDDLEVCLVMTGLQALMRLADNQTQKLQVLDLIQRIHDVTDPYVDEDLRAEYELDKAQIVEFRERVANAGGGQHKTLPVPEGVPPLPRAKARLGEGNTLDVELDDEQLEAVITGLAVLMGAPKTASKAFQVVQHFELALRAQYPQIVAEAEEEIAEYEQTLKVKSIDELLRNAIRPEQS